MDLVVDLVDHNIGRE
jgi:hypothetical protein